MNNEHKILAYKAIDENVDHTTARRIIRYVMECELWGQDTVSPTNEYLSKKFDWSLETVKVAISKAKKSQFITTTGYGKKRCLELNVSFLKGKMSEVYQKSIRPRTDFSDVIPERVANTLANTSANTLANTLANSLEEKNSSTKPQNTENGGYYNNNINNNTCEDKSSLVYDFVEPTDDSGNTPPPKKYNPHKVYVLFKVNYPRNWKVNRTERASAENLENERGLDKIKKAIKFYHEHKEDPYCPQILKPSDLDRKWEDLLAFKRKL